MESFAHARGELVDIAVAVDRDGLPGGVENDLAMMAPAEMLFYFDQKVGGDLTVKIVRQLTEKIGAGHGIRPPSSVGSIG